jgi:hypothetical protein
MERTTRNSFEGGRNADANQGMVPSNQYVSANNVTLVGNGTFYSLQSIAGTTEVENLSIFPQYNVIAVFPNKYKIEDESYDCLTIFAYDEESRFNIICYNTETDTTYALFQETVAGTYNSADRVIDGVLYPENGFDIIYFTDNYHPLRYLKCEIPASYTPNFLNAYDISLLRKGANGTITGSPITGGTLLTGTYQFSYRMADPAGKRFTKWSSLSNPVHVYSVNNVANAKVFAGVGLISNRKITLTITPSQEEIDNFDQLQVAVVENVGVTPPTTASLLDIEEISGSSLSLDYKSNAQVGSIPLEDITIDLAQISTVKTLNVKDNRLFAGNINYVDFEFDNGTPQITSGEIITQSSAVVDSFSSDVFTSAYKGHFRDEVYRYGVVYRDSDGNVSTVKVLDLSAVTDNQISGGSTDLKYPSRDINGYSLFNSSGYIQSLGLRLTGIVNHPSTARSLEIVRLPRKKNILFQSPIVPMASVYGTGALQDYPTQVTYSAAVDAENTIADATPMTSGFTLVPKNMFWPEFRNITKTYLNTGSGTNTHVPGEVKLSAGNSTPAWMVFPPEFMYNNGGTGTFTFSGSEKMDYVDYALLRLSADDETTTKPETLVIGDDVNTQITGTFYALADNQYYFDSSSSGKSIISARKNIAVVDNELFNNFGEPATLSGKSVMDYEALQTGNVTLGFKPNVQKGAVIATADNAFANISTSGALVFSAATLNAYSPGGYICGSSGPRYESNLTNNYLTNYSGYTSNSYVTGIGIVNIKAGYGDDRYGEIDDIAEFISTGAKYTFTESEIATLEGGGSVAVDLDVWGGDCFVGPQIFKIADTAYSVTNQTKNNNAAQTTAELLSKWNNVLYKDIAGQSFLCLPVAVESAAQFIQVVIESEYNGEVREQDYLTYSSGAMPILTSTPAIARSPLTYRYNANLNQNNSQRIYVTEPQFSYKQNEFAARVVYSDIKIYNSDQAGFDIFRALNFYDLDEKYRPITKLALAANDLYSIHEQGVLYLPVGENQIQQSDANILAVRTGDVIGKPIIVDSERGSQHLKSVVETGGRVFFADNRNKSIYSVSGQQLSFITKDNETIFRNMLATQIEGRYLVGFYDPVRNEYWIADGSPSVDSDSYCEVFNEKLGVWTSTYTLPQLRGAAYTNQNIYIICKGANDYTTVYTMYTAANTQLLGVTNSTISFSVNPLPEFSKTFDNLSVASSDRLSSMNFVVNREVALGNQTGTASLDTPPVEGNYRVKTPRDAAGGRLRGLKMLTRINWKDTVTAVQSVITKYRLSARRPF